MTEKLNLRERLDLLNKFYKFNVLTFNFFSFIFIFFINDTYKLPLFVYILLIVPLIICLIFSFVYKNKTFKKISVFMFSFFYFVFTAVLFSLSLVIKDFESNFVMLIVMGIIGSIYSVFILKNVNFNHIKNNNKDNTIITNQFIGNNILFKKPIWLVFSIISFTLPLFYLFNPVYAIYLFVLIALYLFLVVCSFLTFFITFMKKEYEFVRGNQN